MLERLKRNMDKDPENEGAIIDYYRWWFRFASPTRRRVSISMKTGDTKNRIVDTWEIGTEKVFAVHTCDNNRKLWTLTHLPSGLALLCECDSKLFAITFLRFILETLPVDWLNVLTHEQCPNTKQNQERFKTALSKTRKALSC